jgi:hypothetical protein
MGVHYGFDSPAQCIKYMTGSHDQVRVGWSEGFCGACAGWVWREDTAGASKP